MKKNHKILGGFVACLHCCLMALPLLALVFNVGRHCLQANLSYEVTYVYDNNGNYQESSRQYTLAEKVSQSFQDTCYDFSLLDYGDTFSDYTWSGIYSYAYGMPFLMNNDYLGLFVYDDSLELTESCYSYLFINFYLNWIINMSVIVFVPELLVIFIDMCRKLIYSFSHKIDGGF